MSRIFDALLKIESEIKENGLLTSAASELCPNAEPEPDQDHSPPGQAREKQNNFETSRCPSCASVIARDVLFCPGCNSFQGSVAMPEYQGCESNNAQTACQRPKTGAHSVGVRSLWSKSLRLYIWALLILAALVGASLVTGFMAKNKNVKPPKVVGHSAQHIALASRRW
jgi:hypothetical protein